MNDIYRVNTISKTGMFAAIKPTAGMLGHLVLFSLDKKNSIGEFRSISGYNTAISPSGKKVAMFSDDYNIKLYDISKDRPNLTHTYEYGKYEVYSLVWSVDERFLIICVPRGYSRVWPSQEGPLGIIDMSNGKVVWLSAILEPSRMWNIGP